jgi:hypothetical protein
MTGFESASEHAELVTQIRESLPPLFDLVTPIPYVELQKLLDEAGAWGLYAYEKGTGGDHDRAALLRQAQPPEPS